MTPNFRLGQLASRMVVTLVMAVSAAQAQPPNDNCADAIAPVECQNQVPNPNLGVCSVSQGPPNILEVCDMTVGAPPARDCANPAAVCSLLQLGTDAYRCQFATDNRFAATDGPNTQGGPNNSCFSSGLNAFQADIWYQYVAPCTGDMMIHNCGPNNTYDSMLQVYSNHTSTCVGCPIVGNAASRGCSDDNCGTAGAGSALRVPVVDGACYTIRMGGNSATGDLSGADTGISGLDIGVVCDVCLCGISPPTAPLPPHNRRKNRYISFKPSNGALIVAYRVQKTTAPTGSCWVQMPVQAAHAIPAQDTQYTAKCGPDPVFRVWTEPVVHVGDCEIIPVAGYLIHAMDLIQTENTTGLSVGTILLPSQNDKLWGDIAGSNNGIEWTPPNQFTNISDILATLAIIGGDVVRPHFTVANIRGSNAADSCLNSTVNTSDVQAVTQAITGGSYGPPSTPQIIDPALCPACP